MIVGHRKDIDDLLLLIKKKFNIKTEGELNDFLGCNIIRDIKEPKVWLLQPHLIERLATEYEEVMKENNQ